MRCEISIERTGSFFFPQFAVFLCRSGLLLSHSFLFSLSRHPPRDKRRQQQVPPKQCLSASLRSKCVSVCVHSLKTALCFRCLQQERIERADHENVASVTNPFCLQWLAGWLAASKVLHYISHSTTTTDSKLANCLHLPNPFLLTLPLWFLLFYYISTLLLTFSTFPTFTAQFNFLPLNQLPFNNFSPFRHFHFLITTCRR